MPGRRRVVSESRRFALISDVHGNLVALDRVLDDIKRHEIDCIYCLGDLVGYGPDPSGVIARIRERRVPTVRGNYDDGVGARSGSCGCFYPTEQAQRDGVASYQFTDSALDSEEHEWLSHLPKEIRFQHEDLRVLLVHGSPRKINEYLFEDRDDSLLLRLAEHAQADVVCVGHTHVPYHRSISHHGVDVDYVNAGSVGKPKDGDARSCWVEVTLRQPTGGEATTARVTTLVHRVSYDVEAVREQMLRLGLPESLARSLTLA